MQKKPEPETESVLLEYGIVEENGRYGIRVDAATKRGQTCKTVRGVTDDLPRAIALLGLLWKQGVSPANLEDVLSDLGILPVDNFKKMDII